MAKGIAIKVCGMRGPDNIADVAKVMPDYMGFIFYPRSPRYCGFLELERKVVLPEGIEPVAVTVNMEDEELMAIASRCGITTFQLHGNESPEDCRRLHDKGFRVWKAFQIDTDESLSLIGDYEGTVDIALLDTSAKGYGGSGRKFNWKILDGYRANLDFILSGGIGENDADAVIALRHPRLSGVDLNSRFETVPGVKDVARLSRFIDTVRKTIQHTPNKNNYE